MKKQRSNRLGKGRSKRRGFGEWAPVSTNILLGHTTNRISQPGEPPCRGICTPNPWEGKVGKELPTFHLQGCEQRIRANMGNVRIVGRLFGLLKQHFGEVKKRGGPKSWAGYCRAKWDLRRRNIDYMIAQSRLADLLGLDERFPIGRLQPLIGLTDEDLPKAWQAALDSHITSRGYPTLQAIKRAAAKFKPGMESAGEWNLTEAKIEFVRAAKRLALQVVCNATNEQRAQFAGELPTLYDHLKEFCDPLKIDG